MCPACPQMTGWMKRRIRNAHTVARTSAHCRVSHCRRCSRRQLGPRCLASCCASLWTLRPCPRTTSDTSTFILFLHCLLFFVLTVSALIDGSGKAPAQSSRKRGNHQSTRHWDWYVLHSAICCRTACVNRLCAFLQAAPGVEMPRVPPSGGTHPSVFDEVDQFFFPDVASRPSLRQSRPPPPVLQPPPANLRVAPGVPFRPRGQDGPPAVRGPRLPRRSDGVPVPSSSRPAPPREPVTISSGDGVRYVLVTCVCVRAVCAVTVNMALAGPAGMGLEKEALVRLTWIDVVCFLVSGIGSVCIDLWGAGPRVSQRATPSSIMMPDSNGEAGGSGLPRLSAVAAQLRSARENIDSTLARLSGASDPRLPPPRPLTALPTEPDIALEAAESRAAQRSRLRKMFLCSLFDLPA